MVPDFDLLLEINKINKWASENSGVTRMEINQKLKELQAEGVEFDEETQQFRVSNIGYFATFSGYASDDILDLSESEGFIEEVSRDQGKIMKEAFNNYVKYGASNPTKNQAVKHKYSTAGAGSFYLGNIYIPLIDPIQGFLMTNQRFRHKYEFMDPAKQQEVAKMIEDWQKQSNYRTNF